MHSVAARRRGIGVSSVTKTGSAGRRRWARCMISSGNVGGSLISVEETDATPHRT